MFSHCFVVFYRTRLHGLGIDYLSVSLSVVGGRNLSPANCFLKCRVSQVINLNRIFATNHSGSAGPVDVKGRDSSGIALPAEIVLASVVGGSWPPYSVDSVIVGSSCSADAPLMTGNVDKGCRMVVLRSSMLELPAIRSPPESTGPSRSSTSIRPSGYRRAERCSTIVTAAEEGTAGEEGLAAEGVAFLVVGCEFADMKGAGWARSSKLGHLAGLGLFVVALLVVYFQLLPFLV